MLEVLRGDPHSVVIRVSGTFDVGMGAELTRCLGDAATAERVVIDFSQARSLHDADLGRLAKQLAGLVNLSVQGLGRHHRRLLRYCGVVVPAPRPRLDVE
jgi:hypothetical protein